MMLNGRIVIGCDVEYPNSYYYFNDKDGEWYGHWKSQFMLAKNKKPVSSIMKKILIKLAVKQGYPKDIFKIVPIKNVLVHTHKKVADKPKPKSSKLKSSKPKNSTFISLF